MTTRVGTYNSPVRPDLKAAALERNAANGWGLQPGASSIEEGFILRAENPTGPLWIPPGPTFPPTRPSGWWPFLTILGLVVGTAAFLGWWM